MARRQYGHSAELMLSGLGASISGGRWNPQGVAVVYAAETSSLAALETLVHVPTPTAADYVIAELHLDGQKIQRVASLPDIDLNDAVACATWGQQMLGDLSFVGFMLPSFVNRLESTIVLDPSHQDFPDVVRSVEIMPFHWDPRLDRR